MRTIAILSSLVMLAAVACGGGAEPAKSPESTVTATKTEPAASATPASTEKADKKEEKAEAKAEKKEEKAEKKEEKAEAKKKKSAKEVITGEGVIFMFSFADSEGAKKAVDEDCGKKHKKDEKKLEGCKKDAETAAAVEGIRFEKDDKGDWWWVSFGKEKDKEVVFNKVKFKVAAEADGKITLAPEGKDMGKKAMKTLPKEMVLEVTEETVAMTDPKKGKLVYKVVVKK